MIHCLSDVTRFRRDMLGFLDAADRRSEAPVQKLNLGLNPVYLVGHPQLVKPLLKSPESQIDKGRIVRKLQAVLGASTLSINGEENLRRRQVLHGTFTRGAANHFAPEMASVIRRTILSLVMRGKSFDAHAVTSRLALRLISLVMFGKDVLTDADEQVIVEAVAEVEDDLADEMFRVFPLMPWEAMRRRRKRAQVNRALDLVIGRVRARAPKTSAVGALESLNLSDAEIRNEILTMIIAGYHTTGNAAAWLLYHLATVPSLGRMLALEGERLASDTGEYQPAQLARASTSLAAVRETLRLYPSAHWFSREAMSDFEVEGVRLRKGDTLIFAPWMYHRSPRWWHDPASFRLDRDFGNKAYVPFGAGPRVCLGMVVVMMELQLMALEFATTCELSLASPGPVGAPKPAITLVPPPIELKIALCDVQARRPQLTLAEAG